MYVLLNYMYTNEFQYILYFFSHSTGIKLILCFISQKKHNCSLKYDTIQFSLLLHYYAAS